MRDSGVWELHWSIPFWTKAAIPLGSVWLKYHLNQINPVSIDKDDMPAWLMKPMMFIVHNWAEMPGRQPSITQ